jgi:hypothetical protein
MIYDDLSPITRDEYFALFRSAPDERAGEALLRLAWHEEQPKWAESECSAALTDARLAVRLAAATGLGHLARRQRGLDAATIDRLTALLNDPEMGGRIQDALDDVRIFGSRIL